MKSVLLLILAIVLMGISLGMILTNYGEEVTNEYERCYICDGEPCDCQIIQETEGGWIWFIFWISGCGLLFFVFNIN